MRRRNAILLLVLCWGLSIGFGMATAAQSDVPATQGPEGAGDSVEPPEEESEPTGEEEPDCE